MMPSNIHSGYMHFRFSAIPPGGRLNKARITWYIMSLKWLYWLGINIANNIGNFVLAQTMGGS